MAHAKKSVRGRSASVVPTVPPTPAESIPFRLSSTQVRTVVPQGMRSLAPLRQALKAEFGEVYERGMEVLPADDAAAFYAYFRVEKVTDDSGKRLEFVFVTFLRKPDTSPPPDIRARLKKGWSVEWLEEVLATAVGSRGLIVASEGTTPARLDVLIPAVAPPVRVGGETLVQAGVRYSAADRTAKLRKFAWKIDANQVVVDLEHVIMGFTPSWWSEEEVRCERLLREIARP